MVKETSAGLVIFRKNNETKYLLLYALNYWNFPKCLVEKDESPEQTAIREANKLGGNLKILFMAGCVRKHKPETTPMSNLRIASSKM